MKTFTQCIPCFFNQILEVSKLTNTDEITTKKIINKVALLIPELEYNQTPPQIAAKIHNIIKNELQITDYYKNLKEKSNKLATQIVPELIKKINKSSNSLLIAAKLAIAGNIIDFGAIGDLNIQKEIDIIINSEDEHIKSENNELFNFKALKEKLKNAKSILYLGDNCGEIIFDKLFIEEIRKYNPNSDIYFAVRGKPILNDVLMEDAKFCQMDYVAEIISNGADIPGTILEECSPEFVNLFNTTDLIISKGQGNYETLSDCKRPIAFMFLAKCPVVAQEIGCNLRDVILKYNGNI